jgi:Fur family ferric uptake transcriptional regulator
VRAIDKSVGYSTVWRNLKLICEVGLAKEVNVGDGVTRYDRVTRKPHGHLYCLNCRKLMEFDLGTIAGELENIALSEEFESDNLKVEIEGYCQSCREKLGRQVS